MSSALSAKPSVEEIIPTHGAFHRFSRHLAAVFQHRDVLFWKDTTRVNLCPEGLVFL
jgi:hypothetical protein